MATTDISTEIVSITGVAAHGASDEFIVSAQKFVVASVPKELLPFAVNRSSSSNDGSAIPIENDSIIDVQRNEYSCKQISLSESKWANDTTSLKKSTAISPVYWVKNDGVQIAPDTDGSNLGYVFYVNYAEVDDDSDLRNAVIYYSSFKEFERLASAQDSDITTALTAINTELDETQAVCDKIDADLVLAKAEVVLAKTEAAELATQTDNSSTFNTALAAIATELNKVDNIIDLANDEFDEVAVEVSATATSPISLARTAVPSIIGVSDLSIAAVPPDVPTISASTVSFSTTAPSYTSPTTTISGTGWSTAYPDEYSAINTALAAITTEVGLAKVEVAEIVSQTDNSSNFETACDAMATELNKVDNIIVEASAEFDKADNVIVEGSVEIDKSSALLDLGETDSEGAVNTAIVLLLAAVAEAETASGKFESAATDSQFDTNKTWTAADSHLTEVKAALDRAKAYVDGDEPSSTTDAYGALTNEDIELVQAALSIAAIEMQRAQAYVQEWVSVGDMRVKHVNSALAEADGQLKSIQTHLQQAQTKREESQARLTAGGAYLQEANSIIAQGSAYIQEAQAYIAQAGGYAAEVNARGGFTNAKYKAVQGYLETANGYANEVQALLGQTPMKVSEYQAKLQDALNEFNDDNAEYQAQLQVSIQNAQLEDSEESKKLQKYGAELQQYQSEVAAEVQEYQQNLDQKLKEFDSSIKLQQSYYQEAESRVNAGNSYLQEAQGRIAQSQGYASEVGARVGFSSAKTQAVQGHISTAQSYVATAQGFGNEIQAKIVIAQGYAAEMASRLSNKSVHSQSADRYYKMAHQEVVVYIQNNSKMIAATMASRQAGAQA